MRSTVLASFETVDGTQCVDVFKREDGTFGFEQYRSESDGASRWQSLGKYSQLSFGSGGGSPPPGQATRAMAKPERGMALVVPSGSPLGVMRAPPCETSPLQ